MLNNQIEITDVHVNDVELLRDISIQTFTETFANSNTESDMRKYIADRLSSQQLSEELHHPNSNFYFLKSDHQIVGYLKLNTKDAQTEKQPDGSIEIERIYLTESCQGKNFGKLLIQKAIDIAKEKQCKYIWLAVWEHNTKAIAFYKKQGFIEFDKHIFKLGDDEQLDIMMKQELN